MCIRDRFYPVYEKKHELPAHHRKAAFHIVNCKTEMCIRDSHYAYVKNGNGSFSGSNVGKGNWSKIEVAHKGNSITSVSYTHLM